LLTIEITKNEIFLQLSSGLNQTGPALTIHSDSHHQEKHQSINQSIETQERKNNRQINDLLHYLPY